MENEEKIKISIKYCMKMKYLNKHKKAAQRIANALYTCDCTQDDLKGARLLLDILTKED